MDPIFNYDLKTNEIIKDCLINPTDTTQEIHPWIWAENSKYDDDTIDPGKVGKWMIFTPKSEVNALWDKVKEGIRGGQLWQCKVSTTNRDTPNSYVLIIYTKDYDDVKDLVEVLDYLEESGLKAKSKVIKYKADYQTHAKIYAGGSQRASIYSSDSIRNLLNDDKKQTDIRSFFKKNTA